MVGSSPRTPHQHCRHPRTLTVSQQTHKHQYMHYSHRNNHPTQHRVPRQPHRQTKDCHRTTNTTQAHRPSSKSERNLIITDSRSSNCLFTTHMQISSQFRKPSSPLKSKYPKYITSQQCATIGCTRQEVGCCCWRPTPPVCSCGGVRQPKKLR